ncbi:MAG TPA: 3-hydroxyacyl-CoA dehydrogenase family protein [Flavisolibacter sp.]|nr:3-hydroxyacyl-CoA dehydrogenase family protein [Flavisolibacter sp.]
MKIVVLANKNQQEEFFTRGIKAEFQVVDTFEYFIKTDADAYIDLLYNKDESRIKELKKFLPRPIIINSVIDTLADSCDQFIRINGWPTFLKSTVIEAAANGPESKEVADNILSIVGKKIEWVPDQPGFISARVISMIINEAFWALSEGVSTKNEIDTAMKLGTNYPYGPFEWAEIIGAKNIKELLRRMAEEDSKYKPAPGIE